MASIHVSGLNEIMVMMDKLGSQSFMESIAKEVVGDCIPEVVDSLKSAISSASSGHGNSPGELAGSIHALPPKTNALGVFAVARPDGIDSDGNPMEERLRWLDRGFHDRGGGWHYGKGVRDKAVGSVQGSLEAKMTTMMEAKIGEIAD